MRFFLAQNTQHTFNINLLYKITNPISIHVFSYLQYMYALVWLLSLVCVLDRKEQRRYTKETATTKTK